ncbi:MAG: dihydroorotate dehydrogenase electron transfer subunit, partial [Abditibacteriota bacterium]|nr:dihydroorotate dehydrogenase electron transfer subunit [Abditibacteriota bacterium]
MPYIVDAEIISNKPLAPGTMRLVLRSPEIAEECAPGQFVNVHTAAPGQTDPLLKRPLSICRADREKGCIELVYNIVGKGTALLAEMTGRCRIVGPLGKGFPLPEDNCVSLLAGGGVGCAPMCFLADELKKRNKDAYIITGFGTKEQIFTKSLLPGA